jgi:DNA polymerase sigma
LFFILFYFLTFFYFYFFFFLTIFFVQIIKFRDLTTSLKVDLSFESEKASNDAELMKNFFLKNEKAKHIFFVLKILLQNRNMADSFNGGVSSFSLFTFLSSFYHLYFHSIRPDLQSISFLPQREAPNIHSAILLIFFYFYFFIYFLFFFFRFLLEFC